MDLKSFILLCFVVVFLILMIITSEFLKEQKKSEDWEEKIFQDQDKPKKIKEPTYNSHNPYTQFNQDKKNFRTNENNQKNFYKKKGDLYEIQIGKMYQQKGYKVYFKGINEGKKDEGIDLIAYKENQVLLIQCKNWEKSQIKQEHLRIFLGDCTAYIEKEKKKLKNKEISRVFITSSKNLDFAAEKYLESNKIKYLFIPYEKPKAYQQFSI